MKKLFLIIYLLSINSFSQTIVKEGSYEDDNTPVQLNYFKEKNEIGISYGASFALSNQTKINKILKFDKNGNEEVVYKGEPLMRPMNSIFGNSMIASKFSALARGKEYLYIVDGKATEFRKYSDLEDTYFTSFFNFNDKFKFGFVNQKGKNRIDLLKDDLYLLKRNIITDEVTKIKIEKPLASEVIGGNFLKPNGSKIFFRTRLINNDHIEIVTKALTEDYKQSIIYRRVYNSDGDLLSNVNYDVKLDNGCLAYSNSGGGAMTFSTHSDINNFYIDDKTEEVYVYGLFSEKAKSYGIHNKILGYYIYKFSKDGKLLYKVKFNVNDKDGLNKKMYWKGAINTSIYVENDEIKFQINKTPQNYSANGRSYVDGTNLFKHNFILNAETGEKIPKERKKQGIQSKTELTFKKIPIVNLEVRQWRKFVSGSYREKSMKKIRFNYNFSDIISKNEMVKNYITSLKPRILTEIIAYETKDGIWLIESDNKNYYKVLFFE